MAILMGKRTYRQLNPACHEQVVCTCGLSLKRRGLSMHKRSIFHRQHQRIRALLNTNCLTFSEIGKRLGISYERVRQVAKLIGYTSGNERMKVCTIARIEESGEAFSTPLIEALRERDKVTVALIPARKPSVELPMQSKNIIVNDRYNCRLLRAAERFGGTAISIRSPKHLAAAAFLLFSLPDGRWMIVPRDKAPREQTMFMLNPQERHGAHSMRHDWREYIEAWHLLRYQ